MLNETFSVIVKHRAVEAGFLYLPSVQLLNNEEAGEASSILQNQE